MLFADYLTFPGTSPFRHTVAVKGYPLLVPFRKRLWVGFSLGSALKAKVFLSWLLLPNLPKCERHLFLGTLRILGFRI
jgi:hypothetical protein